MQASEFIPNRRVRVVLITFFLQSREEVRFYVTLSTTFLFRVWNLKWPPYIILQMLWCQNNDFAWTVSCTTCSNMFVTWKRTTWRWKSIFGNFQWSLNKSYTNVSIRRRGQWNWLYWNFLYELENYLFTDYFLSISKSKLPKNCILILAYTYFGRAYLLQGKTRSQWVKMWS